MPRFDRIKEEKFHKIYAIVLIRAALNIFCASGP